MEFCMEWACKVIGRIVQCWCRLNKGTPGAVNMARKASIRYWASRKGGGYFTTVKGRQVELALGPDDYPDGPTYTTAMKKWLTLRDVQGDTTDGSYTLKSLFNAYGILLANKEDVRPMRNLNTYVRPFVTLHGALPVARLRALELNTWLAGQDNWNDTSKRTAVQILMSMLSWGAKEGYYDRNPLRGKVTWPEALPRGREARMSVGLRSLLIDCAHTPAIRLFFNTLCLTGARPIELRKAKVKDLIGDMIVFRWNATNGDYRHKTSKKTKKDRIICLPPELADELRRQAAGRPADAPLFLTKRRKGWSKAALIRAWAKTRNNPRVTQHCHEHGIDPDDVIPYGFRHSFISDWVDSGRSIHVCAVLCGTSVALIERVYGHSDSDKLTAFYADFLASGPLDVVRKGPQTAQEATSRDATAPRVA